MPEIPLPGPPRGVWTGVGSLLVDDTLVIVDKPASVFSRVEGETAGTCADADAGTGTGVVGPLPLIPIGELEGGKDGGEAKGEEGETPFGAA